MQSQLVPIAAAVSRAGLRLSERLGERRPVVARCTLLLAVAFSCGPAVAGESLADRVRDPRSPVSAGDLAHGTPTPSCGHGTQNGIRTGENCERWLALDPAAAADVAKQNPPAVAKNTAEKNAPKKDAAASDKMAAEAAVLKRILANWREREELFRTVHVRWGVPSLSFRMFQPTKTRANGRREGPLSSVESVREVQFWLDGPTRFRLETTLLTQPKWLVGLSQFSYRRSFDGKTLAELDYRQLPAQPPHARILTPAPASAADWWTHDPLQIVLAYRPFCRNTFASGPTTVSASEFRLATLNAIRDDGRFVKLQRVDAAGVVIENLWVDPARGDVVSYFEPFCQNRPRSTLGLRYKHDREYGWVPAVSFCPDNAERTQAAPLETIVDGQINEPLAPDFFAAKFPPGTQVVDETVREVYRVASDGSKDGLQRFGTPLAFRIFNALQQRADFKIKDQPFKDAVQFIAKRLRIPVVIDEQRWGEAALDLEVLVSSRNAGPEWHDILDALLQQCHKPLRYRIRDDALVIEPLPADAQTPAGAKKQQ